MATSPAALFQNMISSTINPFHLKDVKDFPYQRWLAQNAMYEDFYDWYVGKMLDEEMIDASTGKSVKKYPIQLNPLKGTARKHVGALFGSNIDSIAFGGIPVTIETVLPSTEAEKKTKLNKIVQDQYNNSNSGALFVQNGMISQKYGGSVFEVFYDQESDSVKITNPSPREFIGIPYGTDYWRLREAWIVRQISKEDAAAYGVVSPKEEETYYYIEHWTEDTYEIMVNGKPVKMSGFEAKGKNPYGIVPMVYIPHLREEGYYGFPILTDAIKGLILEMNLRWADVGDAVNDDTHGYVAIRNVRGSLKVVGVGDGKPIIDLGTVTGMGPGEQNPDMFSVKTNSVAAPMLQYVKDLEELYRREASHPAVADGEDEGSQRSALTLTTRMYPLVQEAETERVFWSIGLQKLTKLILKIMSVKGIEGVTQEDVDTEFLVKWNPMLPRDRDAVVNEAAIRSKNKLGSQQHLIGLFKDVDDIEEMMEEIEQEEEKRLEGQMKLMEKKSENAAQGSFGKPANGVQTEKADKPSSDKTDNKVK